MIIIGGGASGVLLAAQLLARGQPGLSVTLVERRTLLGCGLAYSTRDPAHLLNTRVHQMSAFPDRPRHFQDWLAERFGPAAPGPDDFVTRTTYGDYLNGLIAPWQDRPQPLHCRQGDCLRLEETAEGVIAHLADGDRLSGRAAVLATGHVVPARAPGDPLRDPWNPGPPPGRQERVVLLGTGLTMVDHVLSLLEAGHEGEIVAISRRGLLPRPHGPTKAVTLARSETCRWGRRSPAGRGGCGPGWRRRRRRAAAGAT